MPYRRPPLTKELMRDEISEEELSLQDEERLAREGVALVGGRAVERRGRELIAEGAAWS